MVKFLYAVNAVFQFIFLKNMLGVSSYTWGLDVTMDLWQGREWPETGNFPRFVDQMTFSGTSWLLELLLTSE